MKRVAGALRGARCAQEAGDGLCAAARWWGEVEELMAEFSTMASQLLALRDWLKQLGVTHVAAWRSISPPTESPSPPIRPWCTSVWRCRNAVAASRSLSPDQPYMLRSPWLCPSPAAVEDEHAVAVTDQHPRVLLDRGRASGGDDHRGAVARRDIPAGELEPIAGREIETNITATSVSTINSHPPWTDQRGPVSPPSALPSRPNPPGQSRS